jgi:hypothetical protein
MKKSEYEMLIDQLEAELQKSLMEAETSSLAKSEDGEDSHEKEESHDEEHKEHEDKKDDDHGYSDEDMEELHKMYGSMNKAEHGVHLKSLKKAMCKSHSSEEMEKCWKSEDEAEEHKEEDKKEDEKKEEKEDMEKCGEMKPVAKSELESIKKDNEELKKNLEGLVSAIHTFVTRKAPARKAITEIEYVKKSEAGSAEKTLSKSEINGILSKKAQDPTLSKMDRDAINAFYMNGASLETVKHLLKN